MTSGIIRINDMDNDDMQLKICDSIRRSSSHLSSGDRSSSGVSSGNNSPRSTHTLAAPVMETPVTAYSNKGLREDEDDRFSEESKSRTCTGVLSVQDELCIDFCDHLPNDLRLPTRRTKQAETVDEGLASRCKLFLQSKWRSIPVSMVPVRAGVDQKPLSPTGPDENGNNKSPEVPVPSASDADQVPKPPFSCTPIYVLILLVLLAILVFGAVTTVLDTRPEYLFGPAQSKSPFSVENTTVIP